MSISFPNRNTPIGKLLDDYLSQKCELEDHAAHLLFSANLWESSTQIETLLRAGKIVISDQWVHSGVAYSVAKLGFRATAWCTASYRGLVSPDILFLLDSDGPYTTQMPPVKANLTGDRHILDTEFRAVLRRCHRAILEPSTPPPCSACGDIEYGDNIEGPYPIHITTSQPTAKTTETLFLSILNYISACRAFLFFEKY